MFKLDKKLSNFFLIFKEWFWHEDLLFVNVCEYFNLYQQILYYYCEQQMPIREGKAKLWFNTKEEQVLKY